MKHEWQELTRMTRGEEIIIEQVQLVKRGISIQGEFELPPLSRLTLEDQIFIIAFIRSHGSIKDMEELFGISYPTVKNRLNRISELLEFVEVNPPSSKNEILADLEKGKITVGEGENMIPMILKIRIPRATKSSVNLYLPLFLLWILLLPFVVLTVPLILLALFIAWIKGYLKPALMFFPMVFQVLWNLHGLKVDVKDKKDEIYLSFI